MMEARILLTRIMLLDGFYWAAGKFREDKSTMVSKGETGCGIKVQG
ncbi:MAG: hypothetical protein ACLFWL_08225 [Candidatus Brocadiia bacterium]